MLRIEVGKANVADHGDRPIGRHKFAGGEQDMALRSNAPEPRSSSVPSDRLDVTQRPPIAGVQSSHASDLSSMSGPRRFDASHRLARSTVCRQTEAGRP